MQELTTYTRIPDHYFASYSGFYIKHPKGVGVYIYIHIYVERVSLHISVRNGGVYVQARKPQCITAIHSPTPS